MINGMRRVCAGVIAALMAAPSAAWAQGNSAEQSRVYAHENETPAAQKNARDAARHGQPDLDAGKPGGAYPAPDSASSSGTPAKGKPTGN